MCFILNDSEKKIKLMYLYVQMNATLVEEGMDQSPESKHKSRINLYHV